MASFPIIFWLKLRQDCDAGEGEVKEEKKKGLVERREKYGWSGGKWELRREERRRSNEWRNSDADGERGKSDGRH